MLPSIACTTQLYLNKTGHVNWACRSYMLEREIGCQDLLSIKWRGRRSIQFRSILTGETLEASWNTPYGLPYTWDKSRSLSSSWQIFFCPTNRPRCCLLWNERKLITMQGNYIAHWTVLEKYLEWSQIYFKTLTVDVSQVCGCNGYRIKYL